MLQKDAHTDGTRHERLIKKKKKTASSTQKNGGQMRENLRKEKSKKMVTKLHT